MLRVGTSRIKNKHTASGFTVVELLIVIVVIGILATLTIIAYSGVQDNARRASLQSDVSQSAKKLEEYKFKNAETYPTSQASAVSLAGIKSSGSNALTYTPYTTSLGANKGYCLQETVNGITYYTTAGGSIKEGSCQVITNLVLQPLPDAGNLYTAEYCDGAGSRSLRSDDGPGGSPYSRVTFSTGCGGTGGAVVNSRAQTTYPLTQGQTYTSSLWVRASVAFTGRVTTFFYGSGLSSTNYQTGDVAIPANTWTRVSHQVTMPTGTSLTGYWTQFRMTGTYTTAFTTGSTFDATRAMVTSGSTLYDYADGTSANWNWTGTTNNSTSSGPAL